MFSETSDGYAVVAVAVAHQAAQQADMPAAQRLMLLGTPPRSRRTNNSTGRNETSHSYTMKRVIEMINDDNLKGRIQNHIAEKTKFSYEVTMQMLDDNEIRAKFTNSVLNIVASHSESVTHSILSKLLA